jgi:putative N6-adenine-specific DNA methylase
VAFRGREEDAWRACLHLRAARRVLQPLGTFEAPDAGGLYAGARDLPWAEVLTPRHTFAVEASIRDSAFTHSGYVALKVKDAVADALRDRRGARPDVDRADPDVAVVVHLEGTRCSVSLDASGGPLHKRGYRVKSAHAPLNETLAAGILLLAGYDGTVPFADPFCGSGTLLIEAALIATRTPPGLLRRKPFGFQRWPGYDDRSFRRLVQEAEAKVTRPACRIEGSDRDKGAVAAAAANAAAAAMGAFIRVRPAPLGAFMAPGERGILATNPPYGDHSGAGEDLTALYRQLGDVLKQRCPGWQAFVLTGDPSLGKQIGLKPSRRIPLYNGPLECRLLVFDLYEGSRRERAGEPESRGSGEPESRG